MQCGTSSSRLQLRPVGLVGCLLPAFTAANLCCSLTLALSTSFLLYVLHRCAMLGNSQCFLSPAQGPLLLPTSSTLLPKHTCSYRHSLSCESDAHPLIFRFYKTNSQNGRTLQSGRRQQEERNKQLMINLQNSRKLLHSYDKLVSNLFPPRSQPTHSPSPRRHKLTRPLHLHRNHPSPEKPHGRTITLQFRQSRGEEEREREEQAMRKRMLSTSEKLYNRKKINYFNTFKEIFQRQKVQDMGEQLLAVGSRTITKMNFTQKMRSQQGELEEGLQEGFKSKVTEKLGTRESKRGSEGKEVHFANKVLIFHRKESSKIQNIIHSMPPSQRKQIQQKKLAKKMERGFRSLMGVESKTLSFEEILPNKKSNAKKEPFVFGMSEKMVPNEKNKDKLALYHDFLWKVNYSNGLFVPTPNRQTAFQAYIGPGNNSNLIKRILRRRFWWTIVDKQENCNLVWTQLKVNSIFKSQTNCQETKEYKTVQSENLNEISNDEFEFFLDCGHQKIFNPVDLYNWRIHMQKNHKSQILISEKTYKARVTFVNCKQITKLQSNTSLLLHNHVEQNYFIGNKKSLFYHMKRYYQLRNRDVFQVLPLTFHVSKGMEDPQFKEFLVQYNLYEDRKRAGEDVKNIWIIKPGENSNRGNGISICHCLQDVKLRLKSRERNSDGHLRTFILQKYLQKPMLYKGRKFDIRHYLLITCFNGSIRAYWYDEGYIRTSSSLYNLKRGTNLFVHLTNDAIQQHSQQYGKYENGNKVSYDKMQQYINREFKNVEQNAFSKKILPAMRALALEAVKSTFLSLDPAKKQHNFQLLGMDFMIDSDLKPWLIEINTNPCLEQSSPLLSRLIPDLIENTFRLCIDPFFPPPDEWPSNRKIHTDQNILEQNHFELIFDQSIDGQAVKAVVGQNMEIEVKMGKVEEDADVYDNEGEDKQDDNF